MGATRLYGVEAEQPQSPRLRVKNYGPPWDTAGDGCHRSLPAPDRSVCAHDKRPMAVLLLAVFVGLERLKAQCRITDAGCEFEKGPSALSCVAVGIAFIFLLWKSRSEVSEKVCWLCDRTFGRVTLWKEGQVELWTPNGLSASAMVPAPDRQCQHFLSLLIGLPTKPNRDQLFERGSIRWPAESQLRVP